MNGAANNGLARSAAMPPIVDLTPDFDNIGKANNTDNITDTGLTKPLQDSEIIILAVIGCIGTAGTIMNIGVLAIVYKGRLVKKDYRMAYYIFITVGDLMFAVHTVINAFSILYSDFYVFKIFAVCLNLHVTLGVVSYQWSATCIILLIIDLIWSLKNPFGDDQARKTFSKIGCIVAFIGGFASALVPFAVWNDSPSNLNFCSIANVYGSHWSVYQIEAVSVLSVLFLLMLAASIVLMYILHRTHKPATIPDSKTDSDIDTSAVIDKSSRPPRVFDHRTDLCDIDQTKFPSPHPKKKHDVNMRPGNGGTKLKMTKPDTIETISSTVAITENHGADIQSHGEVNEAYVEDEDIVFEPCTSVIKQTTTMTRDTKKEKHLSKNEVQRKQLNAAFRNVGAFMATYLGSCLPYYLLLVVTIGCSPACNQDNPEQRTIRVVVATFLYMLPILDPILYTVRFSIFKEAAMAALEPCFRCFRRSTGKNQVDNQP